MRRLLLVAVLLLTAGCSQAAALAPVGGNRLTEARFAGNDVLVSHGVALLVAPVCTQTAADVTCQGSTVDGAVVLIRSTGDAPDRITVSVAGQVLYDGAVQDVLDAAARPTG